LQGKGSLGCATPGKLPGNVIISNTEVPEGEKNLLFLGVPPSNAGGRMTPAA